jgi:hypothetical protein
MNLMLIASKSIALLFVFYNEIFRIQLMNILYQSLLAKHEGLPRHIHVLGLDVEASPSREGMYVRVCGNLLSHGPDTSFESVSAQTAMSALEMSDCLVLLEVSGYLFSVKVLNCNKVGCYFFMRLQPSTCCSLSK